MSVDRIELQDSARRVVTEAGLAADEQKLWPLIVELGWLLVSVPEELGGLGQGLPAACALYTELGRGLAGTSYLSAMLAIDAVSHSTLADAAAWVERFTVGDYVAAPLADAALTVTDSAGKPTLTGLASAVPAADKAGHILAIASDRVALVPVDRPGVELTPRPTWDRTRPLFDVRFSNVVLDDALILASGPAAQKLAGRLSTQRDFALASDSVGGAEALLEMTVEYLRTRRQYGRPLALFQALKHRCADLKALIAGAEALLLDSLDRLDAADEDGAEAEIMGKGVKQLACAGYSKVAEEALQLHGGIGMTSEHACHLFLKRALLNENLGGSGYDLDIAAGVMKGA